jgi:alpha-mannosidase
MKKRFFLIAMLLAFMSGAGVNAQENGQKRAKAYMVADAHLDTQWNWDIQTTINHHVWNTINQNLFLMRKYPDYVFNFEGGVKYYFMKEYYPAQYEELKQRIKEGRWHIAGSSWEASDILISSPESSIRSILLGQTFYRQEFGREGTDLFLPDCFGFGWTLPTIATHCSLIGFSTQKLGWRNHAFFPNDWRFPYTVGLWKGIDGSEIMLTHGFGYTERYKDEDLSYNKNLLDEAKMSPLNMVYRYYGTGDIGGSPTISSVRAVEKGIKGDGPIQIISATSDQMYKDFLPYSKHPELPVYDGELLMDVHGTGCYTSKAIMKLYNRQNEQLGDAAERSSVAAEYLGGFTYPGNLLSTAWKRFILHQFHDDLTGTSIPRAYEFSWNDELISLKQFSDALTSSVNAVAQNMDTRVKGMSVVLYNAHCYPVKDYADVVLAMPKAPAGINVFNSKGVKVNSQFIGYKDGKAHLLIEANVPACGYAVYDVRTGSAEKKLSAPSENVIENSVYKVTLDKNGDISSLFDKQNNKELVENGKVIRLALFTENKSYNWPAWEIIKETVDRAPVSITGNVKMTVAEYGSSCKSLCVEKQYGDSKFKQYIRLYEGSRANQIDFYNEVDWRSTNALLKAEFPLNVANQKATYDLGIGSVQRGNNTVTAYEVYAQQWADLTDADNSYGVSIMNDCKYGWDKPDDHTLRLTLIHTPSVKNSFTYQSRQDMGYHTFTYSLIGHKGALDKPSVVIAAEKLNMPLKAFSSVKHNGSLGKEFSFASSDNDNVVVKELKKAEVTDEYVLRVYETGGKSAQKANITFAGEIENACEADGTEKRIGDATFSGHKLQVSIEPYHVKSFKVKLRNHVKQDMSPSYAYVPLTFDTRCFSFNEFRNEGNFDSGYSYAAELLPDSTMTVDNIPFRFGEKDALSGLSCKGTVVQLPKGNYNRVYFLAASKEQDTKAIFSMGNSKKEMDIPYYTGFIGQWEHIGQTKGFLKDAEIAYVGTHRHSPQKDEAYEFTYMFKFGMDIPKGATSITLPKEDKVVIFAMTAVNESQPTIAPACEMFRTSIKNESKKPVKEVAKNNLLKDAKLIAASGYINDSEQAAYAVDGNKETKWCDVTKGPNYIDFDLGSTQQISGWKLLNAGGENESYITAACFLQGKNNLTDEWKTIDSFSNNSNNVVEKTFNPVSTRYIRLLITQPTQGDDSAARVYEFEVYK